MAGVSPPPLASPDPAATSLMLGRSLSSKVPASSSEVSRCDRYGKSLVYVLCGLCLIQTKQSVLHLEIPTAGRLFQINIFQLKRFTEYDVNFFFAVDGVGSQLFVGLRPFPCLVTHLPQWMGGIGYCKYTLFKGTTKWYSTIAEVMSYSSEQSFQENSLSTSPLAGSSCHSWRFSWRYELQELQNHRAPSAWFVALYLSYYYWPIQNAIDRTIIDKPKLTKGTARLCVPHSHCILWALQFPPFGFEVATKPWIKQHGFSNRSHFPTKIYVWPQLLA